MDALAEDFRAHRYDIKHLIRTIMTSSVYGMSSEPNDRNIADTRNFSRYYRQRLRAEILSDAISDVTDVPDSFDAAPPRSRASTIWTNRVPSLFLDTFGRPDPNQDPPCERTSDTAVVQALHLMNSAGVHKKLSADDGRVARLAKSDKAPRAIVEELYLLTYSRLPTREERSVGRGTLPGSKKRSSWRGRRPSLGPAELPRIRVQGLIRRPAKLHAAPLTKARPMAIFKNCESTTRRDCLRLGLSALIGGGLIDALASPWLRRRSPTRDQRAAS